MVLPQALEFDQTPNRILLQKAEEARQQDMLRRKLEAENREKQYQILNEINPATLYGKFEKEVVDKTIGQLTGGIANYIKQNPNASYVDLQNQVNKGLSGVAQWSSRVKIAKDNIDKTISGMDNSAPFDKGRLRALAIDRALYKTDELGRKVFKSPEEIDTENDIVSVVAKESPSKVIDPFKGQELAVKYITDSSLFTVDETKEVDTPNGKQTVITGRKATIPFYLEAKNGSVGVKKQANGYIDEMVFQRFNENPAISVWIQSKAEDLINKSGVEKTPQNMEIFKRSFLTDWLEQNKKGAIENVDKKLYAKEPASGQGGGSGSGFGAFIDIFREINNAADSGMQVQEKRGGKVVKTFGAAVNQMTPDAQSYLVGIANKLGKKKVVEDEEIDFTQADIVVKKENGVLGLYEYPSGNLIAPLNDIQANLKVNPTAKTKQNVINNSGNNSGSEKPFLTSIKRSEIAAKAKAANYTPSEYEALLKEKGIKIIN